MPLPSSSRPVCPIRGLGRGREGGSRPCSNNPASPPRWKPSGPILALPREVRLALLLPGENPEHPDAFVSLPAGPPLTGWHLALHLEDPELFESLASHRIALYFWSGGIFIVVLGGIAAVIARSVGRKIKLARLKNDFVATVSHELKTPLSSIRMLVDTLLEGRCRDKEKTEEYLRLISRENARLSRLIENFLAFSRMERGRHSFSFAPVDPSAVARQAVAALSEKLQSAGFAVEVSIADNLPMIHGDGDALETALLNLLDNAFKYSEEEKYISLQVLMEEDWILFRVSDRGMGISSRIRNGFSTAFIRRTGA